MSARAAASRHRTPGPLSRDMVFEFVSVAHTDLAETRVLLQKEPALARASWDWSNGDWETGLGGAESVVTYLKSRGAKG